MREKADTADISETKQLDVKPADSMILLSAELRAEVEVIEQMSSSGSSSSSDSASASGSGDDSSSDGEHDAPSRPLSQTSPNRLPMANGEPTGSRATTSS